MRFYRFLAAVVLAVGLAGCSPVDSLNPLYTDQDVVFDESLLGQWGTQEDGLNIAKLGKSGYRLVVSGKDDETGQSFTITFDGHLVNLQGHRFLDVVCLQTPFDEHSQPIPEVHVSRTGDGLKIEPRLVSSGGGRYLEMLPGESDGDEYRISMRPRQAHWFYKVVLEDEGRSLKLLQLDDSWVDRQIADGHFDVDYETVEGKSAVLTASTPDLQQLVLAHVDDEQAFRGDTTYKRQTPGLPQ